MLLFCFSVTVCCFTPFFWFSYGANNDNNCSFFMIFSNNFS